MSDSTTRADGPLLKQLRRAVLDHAVAESRRTYRPLLHLGRPGEVVTTFAVTDHGSNVDPSDRLDHAVRADIVAAMWQRASSMAGGCLDRPLVWLTRPGDLDLQDIDAEWLAATRQAFAEAGEPFEFVSVNRHGWHDPRTGDRRTWRRLRPRSGPHAR